MKIAFVYDKGRPGVFAGRSYDMRNDGGSEGSMVRYAIALADLGHDVRIYIPKIDTHEYRGVEWRSIENKARFDEMFDVIIALRFPGALRGMIAPVKALYCCDRDIPELTSYVNSVDIQVLIMIGEYQKHSYQRQYAIDEKLFLISNAGVPWSDYATTSIPKVRGRCIYCSVPERGLGALADIWALIHNSVPEAELHVTGSLELWGIKRPIEQQPQIMNLRSVSKVKYLGKVSREQLILEQLQSQILLLPGDPESVEMCCMSAMECAAARNAIIVTDVAALPERVIPNVTGFVIKRTGAWQQRFADTAIRLMQDPTLSVMQLRARENEQQHDYSVLADQWVTRFKEELHGK